MQRTYTQDFQILKIINQVLELDSHISTSIPIFSITLSAFLLSELLNMLSLLPSCTGWNKQVQWGVEVYNE